MTVGSKRTAIISDLHGNRCATEAALADIDAEGIESIWCLGDLVGYGAFPNETIALIRERDIPTIAGNYDDGVGFERKDCGCFYRDDAERERGEASFAWTVANTSDDNKAYLRSLPREITFDIEGCTIRLVHGSPRRINEYLHIDRDERSLERIARDARCDLLLFGHTHVPWEREIAGVRMVNAGSTGKPKDGDPRACWVLITIAEGGSIDIAFRRVAYDVRSMAEAIRAVDGLPDHFAGDLEHAGRPETLLSGTN